MLFVLEKKSTRKRENNAVALVPQEENTIPFADQVAVCIRLLLSVPLQAWRVLTMRVDRWRVPSSRCTGGLTVLCVVDYMCALLLSFCVCTLSFLAFFHGPA